MKTSVSPSLSLSHIFSPNKRTHLSSSLSPHSPPPLFSPLLSSKTTPPPPSKASGSQSHGLSETWGKIQEGGGPCEACSGGGEGHSGPAGGPGLGCQECEHRGLLQGVKCQDC